MVTLCKKMHFRVEMSLKRYNVVLRSIFGSGLATFCQVRIIFRILLNKLCVSTLYLKTFNNFLSKEDNPTENNVFFFWFLLFVFFIHIQIFTEYGVISYPNQEFFKCLQGWEFAHLIFERIARFLSKNKRMSDLL